MRDAWERFARRGEVIDRQNRAHLRRLTLAEAIQDVEDLLSNSPFSIMHPREDPLPVSLARVAARASRS